MYALLTVKTQPTEEPVSVTDAMAHLRLDQADPVLPGMIAAARLKVESLTGITLVKTEYVWTMTEQPPVPATSWGWLWVTLPTVVPPRIELPRYPVQSVASVTTFTEAGDATILAEDTDYTIDTTLGPARLRLNAVPWQTTVVFTAGIGDDATTVPANLVLMIKLLTAHLYENRGDAAADELPKAFDFLLADYRAPVW